MNREQVEEKIKELDLENQLKSNEIEESLIKIYESEQAISKENENIDFLNNKIQQNKEEIVKYKNYIEILER